MVPEQRKNSAAATPASTTSSPRVVLHVDLDAFFVQVERKLNPTLIGKPMAVQQHADIIAVSYEARALGVTKHMPVASIRREHPTVKLVHVETIGLNHDKVSYRNYRAAARAIFTLVRAFCPPEDGGNSKDACAASGRRAFPRASSANAQKGGPGTFQKVSVDEAYLEPTRRTLLAELLLSSQRKTTQPASAATEPAMTSASAATATRTATRDFLLPRSGRTHGDEGGASGCGPPLVEPPAQQWRYGGTDRDAQSSSRHRGRASGSQDGDDSAEESGWEMSVGYGSLDSDRQSNEWAERRRKGGGSARANRDEEDEEDRLLEAGGLLAARIQQTLSDVLQYDCSIGVASNKFLAKLSTNLAKPRGVRVLLRRDVSSLLASTPATKIPGCGPGSLAAKQFAALGISSTLDLRRVNAAELRNRLGEQLGVKVYDRCRGIDKDPVEPDPIPSRISSQLSLVPLITPAHCLGKPGEKLTPVFPWEVERVKPHLVTLVDDLMERMKEELSDRSRRPTKLCIEYHLHQRGSKSQTFVLPVIRSPCFRPEATSAASNRAEGIVERQQPEAFLARDTGGQEKIGDTLVLPPTTVLVDLALTPFQNYRNGRKEAGWGGAAGRRGGGGGGGGERGRGQTEGLPPVVKLNVSLLGFECVGATAPVAVASGQRTLRDMMWLEKDAASSSTGAEAKRSTDPASPPTSRNGAAGKSAAGAKAVAPSPLAHVAVGPTSPPPLGLLVPSIAHQATGLPSKGTRADGGSSSTTRYVVEEGSVLVRCPRCKACLPVGGVWDAHREEHVSSAVASDPREPAGIHLDSDTAATARPRVVSSSATCLSSPPLPSKPPSSMEVGGSTLGARAAPDGENVEHVAAGFGFGDDAVSPLNPPKDAESVRCVASTSSRGDEGLRQSRKLSELLMVAVMPEQAADVLRERGFLRDDGQTRFADLGLIGDAAPGEQQRTALDE